MNRVVRVGIVLLGAVFCNLPSSAEPMFNPTPSGDISGVPGSVIGWGFNITNDAGYIEITSAQFCVEPVAFPSCTLSSLGTFTDFISGFNDIVVGPGQVAFQNFDAFSNMGTGSFSIDPNAPLIASEIGQLVLTYNVFDADPNGPGPVTQLNNGGELMLMADASINIDVPEPSSGILIAAAVAGIFALGAWRGSSFASR